LRESINDVLSFHTGQTSAQIEEDFDRDRYMTAVDAMEYGLVDEVLDHPIAT